MRKILIALLCCLLTGCAGTVAPSGTDSGGAESVTKRVETVADVAEGAEGADVAKEAALVYGEAPTAREGAFYAGTTVAFRDGAYTSFGDGVYYVRDGAASLIIPDEIPYDVSICTDGRTLFYVNLHGELREANLTDGSSRAVTDAPIYPFGSGVVGAGREVVYVEMPESEEWEDGVPARAASVAAVSRQTGDILESWEDFYGLGCADGFTGIQAISYDVSPRRLLVFRDDGESVGDGLVVDEPYAWGGTAEGGAFWYSVADTGAEYDYSACTLYRVDADGVQGALTFDSDGGDCYGFTVGGFLATLHYSDTSGDFLTVCYDLRTGERIPDERLNPVEGDIDFWSGGYTLGGADYLTSQTRICRMTDGRPVDAFDMPSVLWPMDVKLCGGYILVDCMDGEFYAFSLKADGVHPIPVYSDIASLERYDGKNGVTVTGYYPRLSPANAYQWQRLSDALDEYDTQAAQTAERDAEECLNQASELVENGFVEQDAPFSTTIRAYIQRADTIAFCFTEHRTMDNRVNRAALDIKTGYNFDTTDGHALTLSEVVTDLDGLQSALTAVAGDDDSVGAFLDDAFSSGVSSPEFSWTLGYEGVSFYFNGQVNYPDAPQSVKYYISFSAYPDIFNPKYFAAPDSYAYDILLDGYFTEEYQMEYYAGAETVLPYLSVAEAPYSFHVSVNGADIAVPLGDYPAYGTVIHQCDGAADASQPRTGGSNFLMLQTCGDGMTLDIFTLDDQFREFYDFGQGALPQHLPSDASGLLREWFGNPEQFAVLHFELADESYSNRRLYGFDYGIPQPLDLSGASLAVG